MLGVITEMKSIKRKSTNPIWVGSLKIGGNASISVQSMVKTDPEDISATVKQIHELESLDCQLIRLAVPHLKFARALGQIKKRVRIPIEADIHFNPQLALEALTQGVDAIRLNPGNIYDTEAIKHIVKAALKRRVPIRVGLNSGSIWSYKSLRRRKTKKQTAWERMVDCALEYCDYIESLRFKDIMVSLKTSDIDTTIKAYRKFAKQTDYPLHLGVTAAGPLLDATVKSAIGIGTLLAEGIGDTIRVSVTGPPHEEVKIGYRILGSLGLLQRGPEIISCPTCSRCVVDLVKIVEEVQRRLMTNIYSSTARLKRLRVAIMGCAVNGPGEAKEADIGIAMGKKWGLLFKKGKPIRKIPVAKIVGELLKEIRYAK